MNTKSSLLYLSLQVTSLPIPSVSTITPIEIGSIAPALHQTMVVPCCKPSDQPRDAARREECSDLDEKSLTAFVSLWEGKKDLLESTKMDFYET